MAVNLNGQICRNLPDQVAKNQEDIKELQTEASSYATKEYVDDGLATKANIDDADLTGTTTAENIIVSGDAVIDSLEVQTSITVPTPTSNNDAASKSYVDSKVANLYKYKGTKTNYSNLPVTGNEVGDVWNVTNAYQSYPAGTNYAWTGLVWDALGGSINLSNYATQTDLQNGLATKMTIGSVNGTNDGTNWTNITINGTTKNIPAGGGGTQLYKHTLSNSGGFIIVIITTSSSAITYTPVGGYSFSGTLINIVSFYPSSGFVYYNCSATTLQMGPNSSVLTAIIYFEDDTQIYVQEINTSGYTDTVVAL